jgi:hypothetical protein
MSCRVFKTYQKKVKNILNSISDLFVCLNNDNKERKTSLSVIKQKYKFSSTQITSNRLLIKQIFLLKSRELIRETKATQ